MSNLNIICVLWQGKFRGRDYTVQDVSRLYRMACKWTKQPFDFTCLTNVSYLEFEPLMESARQVEKPADHIILSKLNFNLPGWWSKLELFRKNLLNGRSLYLDLDSIVCGNLDEVFDYPGSLVFASPIPLNGNKGSLSIHTGNSQHLTRDGLVVTRFQSSIIVWDANSFILDYDTIENGIKPYRGDQDFLGEYVKDAEILPQLWMDKLKHCMKTGPGPETKVILGHPKDLYRATLANPPEWMKGLI